jgi:hypothetical protein
LVVFVFAAALAFRHLFSLSLEGYGIYYNGPVYLAFFVLLMWLALPGYKRWPSGWQRRATLSLFVPVCLLIVYLGLRPFGRAEPGWVPLRTERGTMHMSRQKAEAYREAIRYRALFLLGRAMPNPRLRVYAGYTCTRGNDRPGHTRNGNPARALSAGFQPPVQ